jgi:hypothetical protein
MTMTSRKIVSVLAFWFFLIAQSLTAQQPKVRISAWYWLNSAPKVEWQRDFHDMKSMGFTDVLMCWGVDLTGVVTRKHDTMEAIRGAHQQDLGVYLIVWQPEANSLERDPRYLQMDADGQVYDRFDVFNPEWRNDAWKHYLQDVARTYRNVAGFQGYVFDDSFGGNGVISYGPWEEKQFGGPLPRKPSDPGWNTWTKMRESWWEQWGMDTVEFIREIDPNPQHILYVEDFTGSLFDPTRKPNFGIDYGRVMRHFDAVGGYVTPTWTSEPDSQKSVIAGARLAIDQVREAAGNSKPLIFTFWSANAIEESAPSPAVHPTAKEIEAVCDEALQSGVHHLDMYGYRIGEFRVTKNQIKTLMPSEPAPYVITGEFPHKFIWDRPEIKVELGEYLRGLNK